MVSPSTRVVKVILVGLEGVNLLMCNSRQLQALMSLAPPAQNLDGRTIHVREDQQEGMPPPGMGPMGGMGPMMGGGGGGGNRGRDRERKSNTDPELRKTCQVCLERPLVAM